MNYSRICLIIICYFCHTVLSASSSKNLELVSNKITEKLDEAFNPLYSKQKPNPFLIDFPKQKEISLEEYVYIQEKLREIDIIPLLQKLYPKNKKYLEFNGFKYRCSVGINQKLINLEKNQIPVQKLEKIGTGGRYCIVSCAPYDDNRNILLEGLIQQLHKTGFNGYIYYRIGGYPNPTGKEIKYCGVPYALKIFMMMEANNLGFNKVLWLDSALFPLKDPSMFFKHIEKTGAVFHSFPNPKDTKEYIFPKTRKLLQALTGKDPCKSPYICAGIFGINFKKKKCKRFLKEYSHLVKLGRPFLSCFPEEFVFTCLLDKPEFKKCKKDFGKRIQFVCYEGHCLDIDEVVDKGFHFYHKIH